MEYAGARFYASGSGRWGAVDPVLGDGSHPQRLNRYGYVLGDPVNLVDPDGEEAQCWEEVTTLLTPEGFYGLKDFQCRCFPRLFQGANHQQGVTMLRLAGFADPLHASVTINAYFQASPGTLAIAPPTGPYIFFSGQDIFTIGARDFTARVGHELLHKITGRFNDQLQRALRVSSPTGINNKFRDKCLPEREF